jgi:hypothetical protein
MNLNEAIHLLKKNGYSLVNEYYSNPEFDDYALMVRNELMNFYDVDIEDANWVVCEENTADFMHSVWFKMKPEEAAKIIYSKITFNGNSVNKDEFRTVKITENTQRLKKNGYIVESVFDNPEYKEWYGIFHDKLLDGFVSLEIDDKFQQFLEDHKNEIQRGFLKGEPPKAFSYSILDKYLSELQ